MKKQWVTGLIGLVVGIVITALAFTLLASNRAEYPVNPNAVCQSQGHGGAEDRSNNSDPYSWVCYDKAPEDLAMPDATLDIQAWCTKKYPGSRAKVSNETSADSWYCVIC